MHSHDNDHGAVTVGVLLGTVYSVFFDPNFQLGLKTLILGFLGGLGSKLAAYAWHRITNEKENAVADTK